MNCKAAEQSKNDQVVAAVLAHPRLMDAAKALGVYYSTLWRWLQAPELQGLLMDARRGSS